MKILSFKNKYILIITSILYTALSNAADVNISSKIHSIKTVHDGKVVEIKRIQNNKNIMTGVYTKTSRNCPPFCVQPIIVAQGVTTVGEIEVINFIKNKVNKGTGVIIDARTKSWFKKGTIPGSINIPFTAFSKKSSNLVKISALAKLGVTKGYTVSDESFVDKIITMVNNDSSQDFHRFNYSKAKDVLLWCNGIWCGQSPHAIKGMLALGYPAEKIFYYRGGMQAWQSLGLTVIK